jgi:putative serine protease PepD
MDPSRYDPDEPARLAATGSREPVWVRLPDEPPFEHDGSSGTRSQSAATRPLASNPSSQPTRRRTGGWLQTITAAVLGAALAIAGFQFIDNDPAPPVATDTTAAPTAATQPETAQRIELAPAPVLEGAPDAVAIGDAVIPSIVTIQVGTEGTSGVAFNGSGSGVILDSSGHIVTNDHVVAAGSTYQVVLSDGRTTYDAILVGTDPLTDLAVLEIDAVGLQPIALGETTSLRVGDAAVAIGSPLGLEGGPSLTVGVLSAFGRQVQVSAEDILYGMLQTDAPITQGSSGGALVDTRGRLIGITTAVGVSSVGVEGIGFATPVELVRRVTDEIIATGAVNHAFLGILGATSFTTAPDGASVATGVEVDSIEPGSGAEDAGLQAGALITAIDGEPVTTMDDLIVALRYRAAGDDVTITVTDNGVDTQLPVTLGVRP